MTVMPIHVCQHLYFASIHHPQAETFFAFHNGFPITRFIYTIVIQPARIRSKKNALSPTGGRRTPLSIAVLS
jgi:hypothetical protein